MEGPARQRKDAPDGSRAGAIDEGALSLKAEAADHGLGTDQERGRGDEPERGAKARGVRHPARDSVRVGRRGEPPDIQAQIARRVEGPPGVEAAALGEQTLVERKRAL